MRHCDIQQWLPCGLALSILCCTPLSAKANDVDDGLTKFVTRPDIHAPVLKVSAYDPDKVTPGYWFLAPYEKLVQDVDSDTVGTTANEGCRIGPHIYDNNGDLIWSGACQFKGQNFCDFRVVNDDLHGTDNSYLTGILYQNSHDERGRAVVMDASYNVLHEVIAPPPVQIMNMHEFLYRPKGATGRGGIGTAIHLMTHTRYADTRDLKTKGRKAGWIADGGFRELHLATGQTLFEWWGSDHVALTESHVAMKESDLGTKVEGGWNWLHPNSVDKNDGGDYLLSARFTDTVYKISGKNGSIIWRLGGVKSSFKLDGFNFSRQHDARWISSNDRYEIISLFDNAADHVANVSSTSSGLVVEIDKALLTARLVRRLWRPDGRLSRLRGNFQLLPNGNAIGGWSDHCYFSEHTADDEVVFEARAQNERFVTYRTYKFNFTGKPREPPILKAFVHSCSREDSTTEYFVSWNGATEVVSWRFRNLSAIIGMTNRDGFETRFQSHGPEKLVFAEAIASNGSVIGTSNFFEIIWPDNWEEQNGNAASESTESRQWNVRPGKGEL